MKKRAVYSVVIIAILFVVAWTAASPSDTKGDFESANLKVLKVFTGQDGDHVFKAYMVEWKGHEVIASDSLARSNYREGDTVRVTVMRHRHPDEKISTGLLSFQVSPPPPAR